MKNKSIFILLSFFLNFLYYNINIPDFPERIRDNLG